MDNMIKYVLNNMESFSESNFSEIDSLVLSWLSYLSFPKKLFESGNAVSLYDIFKAEYFEEMQYTILYPEDSFMLLSAVVASPRFREIKLMNYKTIIDNESDTQFAAVCFRVLDDLHYVAFRGTDRSFVGWKEDMMLSLPDPVTAQSMAKDFLEEMASLYKGNFLTGGHSKGGNLAVYSAAKCEKSVQDRVVNIYSHDGPGFLEDELADEGFVKIRDRIIKTIPQSSMIGTVLEQECEAKIVYSDAKTLFQHNPFTWKVVDGEFKYLDKLTPDARVAIRTVNNWLSGFDDDNRRELIDTVFSILEDTGVDDFNEFDANRLDNIALITKHLVHLDKDKKEFLKKAIGSLATSIQLFGNSNNKSSDKDDVSI